MRKTMMLSSLACLCMGMMLSGCGEKKSEQEVSVPKTLAKAKAAGDNIKNVVEKRNANDVNKALEDVN